MTTKEKKSIVRLISRQLLSIFLIVSLLSALGYFLWCLQAEKNQILVQQYLPRVENKDRDQKSLLAAISTINNILSKQTAEEFPALHNSLKTDLEQLENGVYRTAVIDDSAYYETGNTDLNLSRIADNSELNEELKFSAQRQLQKVVDNLQIETLDKEVKLDRLFTQIVNDRSNDRVTANRARAHAILAQKLNSFHYLDRLTADLSIQFAQLSIATSQASFSGLSLKLEQTFSIYNQLLDDALINSDELQIQFDNLEKLLFSEQLGISKWRGYLRMAEPYLLAVKEQRQQLLNGLSAQPNTNIELPTSNSPILQMLQQQVLQLTQLKITQQELLQVLYGIGVLFTFFLFFLLISAQRKIAKFVKMNQSLSEEILAADQQNQETINALIAKPDYSEQSLLAKTMSQVTKPAHGESEYQQLKQRLVIVEQLVLEQAKTSIWFTSLGTFAPENQSIWQLLGNKPNSNSLLSILRPFSKQQRSLLIKAARAAISPVKDKEKAEKVTLAEPIVLSLESINNNLSTQIRTLSITFYQHESSFMVTVSDISAIGQLKNELKSNKERYQATEAHTAAERTLQFVKLEQELNSLDLDNQKRALAGRASSFAIHNDLVKLSKKVSRNKNAHTLTSEQFALQLADIPFNSLLNAFALNTAKELAAQNSLVFINIDERVTHLARIDAIQLNALLAESVDILLAGRSDVKLQMMVALQDQNPGQQTVSMTFSLEPTALKPQALAMPKSLDEVISALQTSEQVSDLDNGQVGSHLTAESSPYLMRLLNALNASSVEALKDENEINFSFTLPIATTSITEKSKTKKINLKQAKILILSPKDSFQKLAQFYLEDANAKVDCISDFDRVIQQLSISHLEKHHVDLLVLSAEYFRFGFDKLQQHLAGIPTSLRPKLFVSQSVLDLDFKLHGLYSFSQTPLIKNQFLSEVAQLLKSTKDQNTVLSAETFNAQHFVQNPSMALIASPQSENYSAFNRALSFLGIQATFITNEQQLSAEWDTGRYALLFSEFEYSPFVDVDVLPSLHRGIFHVSEEQFSVLTREEAEIANQWSVAKWPDLESVSSLAKALKDWIVVEADKTLPLKSVESPRQGSAQQEQSNSQHEQNKEIKSDVAIAPDKSNEVNKLSELNEIKVPKEEAQEHHIYTFDFDVFLKSNTLDTLVDEEVLTAELASTYDEGYADEQPAFNLIKFAQRQGSPVLAAYMLDEYLVEVGQRTAAIAKAIEENKIELAMESNKKILSLAEILSADNLAAASLEFDEAVTEQNFGLMGEKFDQLKVSLENLIEFSEAI